jgi:hypothetical protein
MIEAGTLSETLDALQRRGFVTTFTVADHALRMPSSERTAPRPAWARNRITPPAP